jgi:hypothetical protein
MTQAAPVHSDHAHASRRSNRASLSPAPWREGRRAWRRVLATSAATASVIKPAGKTAHHALAVVLGLAALAMGLLALCHPVAFWPFGLPRQGDAPPVWGVGLLAVPVVLAGLAARRAWWALSLELAAWRRRCRRRTH